MSIPHPSSTSPSLSPIELSSLVDGHVEPGAGSRVSADWRDDAEMRVTWHAYHLIGDVLRSDDLATAPAADEAFLQRLRARLAAEPVVMAPAASLAPAAPASQRRVRRAWIAPAAVAAGFVVVAGVLVVTRVAVPQGGSDGGPALAAAPLVTPADRTAPVLVSNGGAAPVVELRDAALDRYLHAHKQYSNGAALSPIAVMPVAAPAAAGR